MSCFIVPMVQAIATTTYRKINEKSSGNNQKESVWVKSLPTLELMLWGGTLMLLVDHIINGELAMKPTEMLTVGVPMSLAVTLAWAVWVKIKAGKLSRQSR